MAIPHPAAPERTGGTPAAAVARIAGAVVLYAALILAGVPALAQSVPCAGPNQGNWGYQQ